MISHNICDGVWRFSPDPLDFVFEYMCKLLLKLSAYG